MNSEQAVFLKADAKLEPLAFGWYAWPHLIAPAQHAMNIAYRHLPLAQSFVSNPSIHRAAAKDPKLLGGPFVALEPDDVSAVSQLIEDTRSSAKELIGFAHAYRSFDEKLQSSMTGFALHDCCSTLPECLSGLVELVYDSNNHPRVRLLERLVDVTGPDNRHGQSIRLTLESEVDRRFFMSTPRIARQQDLCLNVDFADPRIDQIICARFVPVRLSELGDLFELDTVQREKLSKFFSAERPVRNYLNAPRPGIRIRYFGHACVLIQVDGVNILLDPLFALESSAAGARFTSIDLPDSIDYLIISHGHQDHCCPEALLQIRHKVKTVVVCGCTSGSISDPSLKLILGRLGYGNVVCVDPMDVIEAGDARITFFPFMGEHADLDIFGKQTVLVEAGGRRILFLVDSDGVDAGVLRRVRQLVGPIDCVFIGMECHGAPLSWLYGPLFTRAINRRDDESRRLSGANCARAWRGIRELGCSRVFVYAMGQEPWLRYLMGLEYDAASIQITESDRLIAMCLESGIAAERLFGCRDLTL